MSRAGSHSSQQTPPPCEAPDERKGAQEDRREQSGDPVECRGVVLEVGGEVHAEEAHPHRTDTHAEGADGEEHLELEHLVARQVELQADQLLRVVDSAVQLVDARLGVGDVAQRHLQHVAHKPSGPHQRFRLGRRPLLPVRGPARELAAAVAAPARGHLEVAIPGLRARWRVQATIAWRRHAHAAHPMVTRSRRRELVCSSQPAAEPIRVPRGSQARATRAAPGLGQHLAPAQLRHHLYPEARDARQCHLVVKERASGCVEVADANVH
mmetsp:Transcript_10252/g.27891  ORF Transcript_10252/g.27891 Transcript_10252/m.27891 type:complete len:268 (+) Transcript_10252:117-920(+)